MYQITGGCYGRDYELLMMWLTLCRESIFIREGDEMMMFVQGCKDEIDTGFNVRLRTLAESW